GPLPRPAGLGAGVSVPGLRALADDDGAAGRAGEGADRDVHGPSGAAVDGDRAPAPEREPLASREVRPGRGVLSAGPPDRGPVAGSRSAPRTDRTARARHG